MRRIRIDWPGDGEWIMERVGGEPFKPRANHSLMTLRDGERVGGFVLCQSTGASIVGHMAGDRGWLHHDLLWMVFHYVFVQLGCRKFIAIANTGHPTTVAMDLRAGFRVEAVVKDAYWDGDMLILTMTRETCRWLSLRPRAYKAGGQQLQVS